MFHFKKKHKKKSKKAKVDENGPSLMMEDHEVIDGDNTPLQSPREDGPSVSNIADKLPVENGDKV